uniref:Calponin n=1 Tax=Eptatretus burgeri TaxID=7764 RepID=A0A8C4NGP4_EPTBU
MTSYFNKGPSYGLSAEVRNKILQKYDPVKEQELQAWIEEMTGCTIAPNFQNGLRNGVILCKLINKLQPGSIKKANESNLNWHQAKTKGIHTSVDVGVKYAHKQQRSFSEEKMKAGQCVIGLQMGTNKCASQAGMTAYGTRRHLYDPKTKTDSPMDHASISLQMGTNKLASQAGMTAPGTRRHIYDHKLGTEHCDESTIPLQTGPTAQADVSKGIVYGLGRQIYDPKYCTSSKMAAGSRDDASVGDGGSNGYRSDGYRADFYNADCLQDDDNDECGFN